MKLGKIILGILILFLVVIGGAALYVTTQFDPNAYRTQISEKVSETLGRKLTINGPITFAVFPTIKLALSDVILENADWAGKTPMVNVKNLEASLELMPLLHKQIVIEGINLKGATLNLTQLAGRNNWTFASEKPHEKAGTELQKKDNAEPLSLEILSLAITDTTLNYNKDGKITNVLVKNLKTSLHPRDPLALTAEGEINKANFKVDIKGDKLAGILSNAENWPVKGDITLAGTKINFDGALQHPQKDAAGLFRLKVDGNGKDFTALTGSPLPFGAFNLNAQLQMPKPEAIGLKDLNFTTGQTKATGQLNIATYGKPTVTGTLNIPTLNLADFDGGKSAAPAPAKQGFLISSAFAADGRIIPAIALPTAALRGANAKIDLNIGQIIQDGKNIAALDGTLNLQDANLRMAPMKLQYGGNTFTGNLGLNGASDVAALTLNLDSPNLDYGKLLSELKLNNRITGTGALNLSLSGNGRDLRQVFGSSSGKLTLTSNKGQFDTGILFDQIGNVINMALGGANIPNVAVLRCANIVFTGQNGTWTSNQSAVDSNALALILNGDVNLASEQLNLKALPTLKSTKLGGIVPPLKIAGDLQSPRVTTDGSSLAQSVLTASALGKVKGLDILRGFGSNDKDTAATATNASAGGGSCLSAVQSVAQKNAPQAATPAATTDNAAQTTKPDKKHQIEDAVKGLQGLFGK